MAHYLLPCRCGRKLAVGPADAGRSIPCPCGANLDVPTLRAIRQLEQAPAAAGTNTGWGIPQKLAFVGLVVFCLALAFGSYAVSLHPQPVPTPNREVFRKQLDQLSVLKSMMYWNQLAQGPQTARTHAQLQYAEALSKYHVWLALTLGTAVLGTGFCGGALLVSRSMRSGTA